MIMTKNMIIHRELRECRRCGWKWFGRKEKTYLCPKCHSALWAIPKGK
ncbi:MAG: hypothetical protein AABX14_03655 [Candidatus Aenigmatarchaeota archaeon]|nr:hypothetical protein [archaeon]